MQSVILMTAGKEDTSKGIRQLHVYENYADCILESGGIPIPVCVNQQQALERLAELSQGLFLTGGEDIHPARYGAVNKGMCGKMDIWRDGVEWKLCELFVKMKKPILGICRGHQVLNTFFGGTLVQDLQEDWELEHPYHSNHMVEAADGSWFQEQFGSLFTVNSYHHQAVEQLGKDMEAVVSTVDGRIIEASVHRSLPIVSMQWHPERMVGKKRFDLDGPDMSPVFDEFMKKCKRGLI